MIILYLIFGVILDVFIAKYTQYTVARRPMLATLYSFLIALLNIGVMYGILFSGDVILQNAIAYAVGTAIGTYLGVMKQHKKLV